MKHTCRLFSALAVAFFLASCGSPPDVIVVDSTGSPVVGAAVVPAGLTIGYKAVLTDTKGEVRIGSKVQAVQWIDVRKAGYLPQRSIDFTKPKPIRVVLTR